MDCYLMKKRSAKLRDKELKIKSICTNRLLPRKKKRKLRPRKNDQAIT